MIIANLAPNTEILFTDSDGNDVPARIVTTIAPGQFRIATDEEGNHTAQATYSDEPAPMTFRFPSTPDVPAAGKKKFKPGQKAEPETTPAA